MARYTQDTRTQQEIDALDAKILEMAREISESDEIGLEMSEE